MINTAVPSTRAMHDASRPLRISAIVCTRNRSMWSALAVKSLFGQDLRDEQLEIVVVDNASTDDTASVLTALVEGKCNARYVFEPDLGLSRARNRGIAETSGDVVAFLDDDAEAVPGWARHLLERFQTDQRVVGVGGRIDLSWPGERPEWLPAAWDGMYAGLDLGESRELNDSAIPYGANMAFRRSALPEGSPFAVSLGRRAEDLTSGEERELFERLRAAGGRVAYEPEARVTHHVLPDRADRGWFLRRVWAQGRTHVLVALALHSTRSRGYWLARAGYEALRATLEALRWIASSIARRTSSARMDHLARAVQRAGICRESLRVATTVRTDWA